MPLKKKKKKGWLQHIKLDCVCKYADVFKAELGTMKGIKAKLVLKAGAVPKFIRSRPVPFALKEAVEEELHCLEEQGILRRITHSSWAAPIVVVPKKDGRFRLCGDYKMTINQYLEVDRYPLPKPNDFFATPAGGQKFSNIDLSQAYQHYTRLPFGVASAPALFQRAMDSILQGIAGVICCIDDILVTGKDDVQHLQALEQLPLQRTGEEDVTAATVAQLESLPITAEQLRAATGFMSGKRRYCDHCGESVCKSTYFEHQLVGAYEHVGSTEVDHEFTIDVDKNKPYSSDSESDVEIENEMSNQGSSNECSSDAETSDREVRGE
eukprot:Em0012g343a